ncbi:zinc-binding dehydrogenase, partial [Pseudomonas aeruginosa]|uniref:zinc-binding dehydrogenase n=1 Tax=Pseudomonas aeruginosa TaxID=287 RepID=UPI003CC658A0
NSTTGYHLRWPKKNSTHCPGWVDHYSSTLRSRSHDEKGAIIAELERQVWPHVRAGTVRPQVFRTFPLEEARQAHELMDSGQHIGKIVLTSAP